MSTWFYMGYIWDVIKPCHRSTPVCQGYMSLFLVYITLFSLPDYSLMLYVPPPKKKLKMLKRLENLKTILFCTSPKVEIPPLCIRTPHMYKGPTIKGKWKIGAVLTGPEGWLFVPVPSSRACLLSTYSSSGVQIRHSLPHAQAGILPILI